MIEPEKERLTHTKDLKDVQIGPQKFHITKLAMFMMEVEEEDMVALL